MPKTSSIRPVVSTQYRFVTDGQKHDDSIYRASTASRGKKGNETRARLKHRPTDAARPPSAGYSISNSSSSRKRSCWRNLSCTVTTPCVKPEMYDICRPEHLTLSGKSPSRTSALPVPDQNPHVTINPNRHLTLITLTLTITRSLIFSFFSLLVRQVC